ncbi:PIN domain-containing protein [Candidatus Woesearchaeota archaeon]|nr:PIN domain-containing protein [Candidatus Woesearchaeota archaeon]
MTLYYLDTSIWLDYYEARGKHGEYIKQFLEKLATSKDIILISDILIKELKNNYLSMDQIHTLLRILRPDHIKYVFTTKPQRDEARIIARQKNIPKADVLHALLSRDHEAILLTRDRDFEYLTHITSVQRPEEFL